MDTRGRLKLREAPSESSSLRERVALHRRAAVGVNLKAWLDAMARNGFGEQRMPELCRSLLRYWFEKRGRETSRMGKSSSTSSDRLRPRLIVRDTDGTEVFRQFATEAGSPDFGTRLAGFDLSTEAPTSDA